MKTVSIVIPAFNEGENILAILQKLKETFEKLPYRYEVIMVDDGSKDRTLEIIKEQALIYENLFFFGIQ